MSPPEQFCGIEVKPWAKEIAELVLWIGYLQWQVRQTGEARTIPEPVLRDYHNIECRDAVLAWDGEPELARDEHGVPITRWDGVTTRPSPVTGEPIPDDSARIPVYTYKNPRPATWPPADFIVGNPPYIGNKRMRTALGDGYVEALRAAHTDVPETADYVIYWWDRAASLVAAGTARRFGLITTNSITQVFNRKVVERRLGEGGMSIAFAIPDHPWVDSVDGAAVRVAMTVGEGGRKDGKAVWVEEEVAGADGAFSLRLGARTGRIAAALTAGPDASGAGKLASNQRLAFQGMALVGEGFVVEGEEAARLRAARNGMRIVRRYRNGRDLTQSSRNAFVIDFLGCTRGEAQALHPDAFQVVLDRVKPQRDHVEREHRRVNFWLFGETVAGFREAVFGLPRYLATCRTAKHRVFEFLDGDILPDAKIIAIALSDGVSLAVLSSRLHRLWALHTGAFLEDRPNYNHSDCFATFPFPILATQTSLLLSSLGEQLDAHRKARQAEHPGLTITGMYNVLEKLRSGEALTAKEKVIHEQGLVSVLKQIHDEIDAAVFAAYGWPATLSDEEILERLVALNHERAEEEKRGLVRWLRPEFQNPGGGGTAVQDELPGTAVKVKKGAKSPGGETATAGDRRRWPKDLPGQIAAVRDLLAERGALDLAAAKAALQGAKDVPLAAALDSLVAVGLAVVTRAESARCWSVVR